MGQIISPKNDNASPSSGTAFLLPPTFYTQRLYNISFSSFRAMKRAILLAVLLLAGLGVHAQATPAAEANQSAQTGSISALDDQNGFRTYVLGMPISNYPQLKRKSKELYESPKEPLLLDNVTLTSLNFTSYKGRLASIGFGTLGTDKAEALLRILTAKYGPSTTVNAVLQTWVGNKVTLYVTRVGGGDYEMCMVILKSNELAAAERREQSAAAK
jgi:hypothetical protein